MSLVTINLRLVILELQDFRLMPNLKISSKQIIQLRGRTSKQFNIQQFQNSTSYRENASLLNSPWVLDCDLDHDLLEEEERMIYEVKTNQLQQIQQIQLIINKFNQYNMPKMKFRMKMKVYRNKNKMFPKKVNLQSRLMKRRRIK